jgi:hypothetical protein
LQTIFLTKQGLLQWINTNELAGAPFVLKFNYAFDQGEKRVVLAATDILTWLPPGASLTRKDVAAENVFASKSL